MFARGALDIFDDLFARALRRLSHRPLLGGYDEQQTLSSQMTLFGPIGADVRQAPQSKYRERSQSRLTQKEIAEVIWQMALYGGFSAAINALNAALEVFESEVG